MPVTRPILGLIPGDVVLLPTTVDGATIGPLVVEWVREDIDGTVCIGWHACREDHELCLPLDLAARGALVLSRATPPQPPTALHHAA